MTQPFAVPRKTGGNAAWIHGEPGVEDLVDDPLVKLVLCRDGLTAEDLRCALAVARKRLDQAPAKETRAA